MAMPKPKKMPVEQMLRLIDQLSPEELAQFQYQMSLKDLRREIMIGVEQANKGELIPAEEVLQELRERAQLRMSQR